MSTRRLRILGIWLICGSMAQHGPGLLSSCHDAAAGKHAKAPKPVPGNTGDVDRSQPFAEVTLGGMHMGRPPKVSFAVNFVLHNPLPESRWFLLPLAVPAKSGNQISVLEEYHVADKSKGTVVVGHTIGSWAFQIVKLPAKSKLKIQKLGVSYWGEPPRDALPLEVLVVKDIRIGDKPAHEWFSQNPTAPVHADVNGEKLDLIASKKPPAGPQAQLIVTTSEPQHLDLSLNLSAK